MKKISLLNKDTGNKETHHSVETIKRTSTHDPNMICVEIYNHDDRDIVFTKMYPHHDGPQVVICHGKDWCFLPHQYYIASNKSGHPIKITKNYGNKKFIGNKYQSRPE